MYYKLGNLVAHYTVCVWREAPGFGIFGFQSVTEFTCRHIGFGMDRKLI